MFAVALLEGGGPIQARAQGAGRPQFRLSRVDASGSSQVSSRSILYLCSAPRPRSNRCALTLAVTSMLPPLPETTKASDDVDFGAHSRSLGTCSPTLRVSCCHSRARLASGWLAGLYREGVTPSGSLRKVSGHMVIPLSCPPDATHVPYQSLVELRAASMPDVSWAVSGIPQDDPEGLANPRF